MFQPLEHYFLFYVIAFTTKEYSHLHSDGWHSQEMHIQIFYNPL